MYLLCISWKGSFRKPLLSTVSTHQDVSHGDRLFSILVAMPTSCGGIICSVYKVKFKKLLFCAKSHKFNKTQNNKCSKLSLYKLNEYPYFQDLILSYYLGTILEVDFISVVLFWIVWGCNHDSPTCTQLYNTIRLNKHKTQLYTI